MDALTPVFLHKNYQDYLLTRLGAEGSRTGLRKKAAEFMGAHPSLISQVLTQRVELNLEQAESLNSFLKHSDSESEFFLLLVQSERAGTQALKQRLRKRMDDIRSERTRIIKRIPENKEITEADRDEFYRSWLPGALHVLVSVPQFQTIEALAKNLNFSKEKIEKVLELLVRTGLVVTDGIKYEMGSAHIHLGADHPQIQQHHRNWRLKTIEALEKPDSLDLHYSGAVTLSAKDADVIRERFMQFLSENLKLIKASPAEKAYVMSFDFFKL